MSVCFIKCLLFLKISPNSKTLFYKTFSRNLVCSALKVSKTFHRPLACFLYFDVYKTFHRPLACLLYFALKVYKTFYKHGILGSTACFKGL